MTKQHHSSATRKRRLSLCITPIGGVASLILLLACGMVQLRGGHSQWFKVDALVSPSIRTHTRRDAHNGSFATPNCRYSQSMLSSSNVVDESSTAPNVPVSKNQSTKKQPKRRSQKQQAPNSRSKQKYSSPSGPWNADYNTSVRTQKKIQTAATSPPKGSGDSIQVANSILRTLLDAPSTECNAANVVCALTLSAKTVGGAKGTKNKLPVSLQSSGFQRSLMDTLDVLQMLVDKRKLAPRQLCNAAWAVAKHVDYDDSLFPRKNDNFIFVKDNSNSYATWDLNEQQLNDDDSGKRIDEVFNLIALRMIEHLDQTRDKYGTKNTGKRVQSGELCMLLWAYAVAKPRDCPPGWEQPRRLERLTDGFEKAKDKISSKNAFDKESDVNLVTFLDMDDSKLTRSKTSTADDEDNNTQPRGITSRLFDAAAISFCQGEGAAVMDSEKKAETMLKSCTWNELANIAWSFATRGACGTSESDAMMTFLAKEATRRIKFSMEAPPTLTGGKRNQFCKLLPRDVVQIAWALGTMESDNASVGDALVYLVDAVNEYWIADSNSSNERHRQIKSWKCADLVQMATALSHGRLDNQSVLTAIYEESLERIQSSSPGKFSTSEISILLWAQARLYLTSKYGSVFQEFTGAAARKLMQQMKGKANQHSDERLLPPATLPKMGLRSQEQANLAWSLTVLGHYDSDVVALLQNIFHAASSSGDGVIQLEHAHQLWQSYFLLSEDCPAAVEFVPAEFSQFLEKKWNIEKNRGKQSSSRHRTISQTLELMRVAHRNEYDEDVDVAIVLQEDSSWTHTAQKDLDNQEGRVKVAVEFDGPFHFTVMASTGKDLTMIENGVKIAPRVLGHTVLKYRLLKKKGWAVVRIPYYEWDKIPSFASMERQRYLQRALKTHETISFSGVDVSQYQAMPQTRHSRFD